VHTKVEDLAGKLLETDNSVSVIDEHGEVVGTVSRQAVLDVLVRKNGAA
jgi:CBS-domain-containing membrane protein